MGLKALHQLVLGFLTLSSLTACTQCQSKETKNESAPASASAPAGSKGVGPVTQVALGAIDQHMVTKGQRIFESKCASCHSLDQKMTGPALRGVTQRRTPEWIMNMMLAPGEMLQKDQTAKDLLAEYMTQMPAQNLSENAARDVLEYLRSIESAKP